MLHSCLKWCYACQDNCCLRSLVCSGKIENLCLIGLVDEIRKLTTKFDFKRVAKPGAIGYGAC